MIGISTSLRTSLGMCKRLAGKFHREQTDVRPASFWWHIFPTANSATSLWRGCGVSAGYFGVRRHSLPLMLPYCNAYHVQHAKFQSYPSWISSPMLAQNLSQLILLARYLRPRLFCDPHRRHFTRCIVKFCFKMTAMCASPSAVSLCSVIGAVPDSRDVRRNVVLFLRRSIAFTDVWTNAICHD